MNGPILSTPCGSPAPAPLTHRLLAGFVCALLGWSAWARGGSVTALQHPLPWLGLAILIALALDRRGAAGSSVRGDIVFWAGLAFLLVLTVQWWNAGRMPYFHPFSERWVFTPPHHAGWPSAVDRNDASEMLRWFFPAWALMLALRHARHPDRLASRVAWFLIVNAGLLAAFGIAQALRGTHRIFWMTPMTDHFFASFGYENHAASYFAMLFALSAGVLLSELRAGSARSVPRPTLRRRATAIASVCAVLCLAGVVLSFSRTGMALAVCLSVMALIVAARLFWPLVSVAQRIAVVTALIMGVATFFFVVASMGGVHLAREAARLPHANLSHELDMRLFMGRSAVRIWMDNPGFGVGGWGYRHFLPLHAAAEGRTIGPGHANAHNDAVQFLCEFGSVGFGLMLTATIAFAWPLLRRIPHRISPGRLLGAMGLLAVLFHSLIDLPFRSPDILYAWLAVCGVAGTAGAPEGARPPSAPARMPRAPTR